MARLFKNLLKKNQENIVPEFKDIINKIDDSFSITKYKVNSQVNHEEKTNFKNLD